MRVIIFTNKVPKNIKEIITINKEDYIIVVDGALDKIRKKKFKIDLVVGDLDSLKHKKYLKNLTVEKLSVEKDITDTYAAVNHAYKLSNEVIIVGGIQGNRIEHFLANLSLFDQFENLIIIDDFSKISLLNTGKHMVPKSHYTSFFAKEKSVISLKGFKYELDKYNLNQYDPLAISNHVIQSYGEVIVHSGKIFMIETKKGD